jgi:hypothetical protein
MRDLLRQKVQQTTLPFRQQRIDAQITVATFLSIQLYARNSFAQSMTFILILERLKLVSHLTQSGYCERVTDVNR